MRLRGVSPQKIQLGMHGSTERIARNPAVLGKPIVRGNRISVELIVGWLAAGETPEQIIADYPVLTAEDIAAAEAYAQQMRERTEVRSW